MKPSRRNSAIRSDPVPDAERWNRNIHYHPILLALGPADRVLDVGCGCGLLTRQFAAHSTHVVGIDLDEPSIHHAQAETPYDSPSWPSPAAESA